NRIRQQGAGFRPRPERGTERGWLRSAFGIAFVQQRWRVAFRTLSARLRFPLRFGWRRWTRSAGFQASLLPFVAEAFSDLISQKSRPKAWLSPQKAISYRGEPCAKCTDSTSPFCILH